MGYLRTQVGSDVPPPGTFNEAKRSTINMNGPDSFTYAFIDHMRQANSWCGPSGGDFYQLANSPFPSITDANGWPSSASAQNLHFGGGLRIPGTDEFAGPYVLTWTGDGAFSFNHDGTHVWTANTTSILGNTTSTYTGSNGSYTNVPGQTAVVVFDLSGNPGPFLMNFSAVSTGTSNFMKNVQFYRVEDKADLDAGKVFRRAYKQMIVDCNPYAVRFLDWAATNDSMMCRWENRLQPTDASWFFNEGGAHQPKYTKTSSTPTNSLVLDPAGVSGMPATMTHGELVTFRQDADFVRTTESRAVTAITRNNTATNTVTCNAHGFANGDTIQIQMHDQVPGRLPAGMVQLHDVPCVISNVTTNTFDISVNTSTYGALVTPCFAWQYITLNVGNRGAYPIVDHDCVSKAGRFFNFTVAATGLPTRYRAFMFHKDVKASSTITGAWLYPPSFYTGHCGLPIEIMVKFINECMELNPKNPINMYYNLPHFGLQAGDQDYTTASDWPINAVDCILNPSSTVRASGWSALDSRCKLLVEYANETWNFPMGYGLGRLGWQLWGGTFSLSEYSGLRGAKAFNAIRSAFPGYSSRLKTIQGMFSTGGTGDSWNKYKIISSANQQTAMGSAAAMITYCDYIAMAFYAQNNSSTPANSLSTALAAFQAAGTNNTAVEAACAAYAVGFADATKGGNETISRYRDTLLIADYAAVANTYGRRVIGYEGGLETGSLSTVRVTGTFTGTSITGILNSPTITVGWYIIGEGIPDYTRVTASGAGTATVSAAPSSNGFRYFWYFSPQDAFIYYFKRSQAWADTYITWFNAWNSVANADAPPEFIMTQAGGISRWNHDIDDAYLGGVEGAALDKAWLAMKARNNS